MSLQKLQIHFCPPSINFTKGFIYALQSLHLIIGLLLKFAHGTGSPLGSSPNGLTIIANGIPDSFDCYEVLGILSVVNLSRDLSEL